MGGGASSMNMEDLIQTTVMVGRAIAAITFPGMYRIYDFHSSLAPRIKSARHFVLFSDESDEEDALNSQNIDPSTYEHFFKVMVNDEAVYLEDVLFINEQGWQALHTTCMSYVTSSAGLLLIDEMIRLGASFENKTKLGPGTFNKGWTCLHMAAAYGVEPLVEALLNAGADPNCTNSFGYTPMLEACHRGFTSIVGLLIKNEVNLDYIPIEEAAESSPFVAAPSQSALGEASRCGFVTIVKALLDAGAQLDQKNTLGWTPLHEACFYNRVEVVKTLLSHGASSSIRSRKGALPYHLSGLPQIRTVIQELGGPGSVPVDDDTIDMMEVLHELTMSTTMSSNFGGHQPFQFHFGLDDDDDQDEDDNGNNDDVDDERLLREELAELTAEIDHAKEQNKIERIAMKKQARKTKNRKDAKEEEELLHSGRILGDLPSLNRSPPVAQRISNALDNALEYPESLSPEYDADDKKKKKKYKSRRATAPADIPTEFVCQLSQQPMSDPVRTIYGHVFDLQTIKNWFKKQGHICPLTGAPLAESDLRPCDELGHKIRQWILNKSLKKDDNEAILTAPASLAAKPAPDDDLYDF